MPDSNAGRMRVLNDVIETVHAVLYFGDEVQQRWERLGMEPRSEGYFAGRAAPMGRVGPGLVTATFFNFNPALVARAVPGVWDEAEPATVLDERAAGLQSVFERVGAPTEGLAELTRLAVDATAATGMHGRPLAAANAEVPLPEQPFARAWQALAVLREHRGDGHVAVLTAAGLGPVESLVLMVGWQEQISRRFFQRSRLWDDDDWDAAVARLATRGLAGDDGQLTEEGRRLRERIETDTDRLAAPPYERLPGTDGVQRLFDLVRPLAAAVAEGGVYPRPPAVPDALTTNDDQDVR